MYMPRVRLQCRSTKGMYGSWQGIQVWCWALTNNMFSSCVREQRRVLGQDAGGAGETLRCLQGREAVSPAEKLWEQTLEELVALLALQAPSRQTQCWGAIQGFQII